MRFKADLFFFGVIFLINFFMVFSVIKKMQHPVFKQGLKQSAGVMVKTVR